MDRNPSGGLSHPSDFPPPPLPLSPGSPSDWENSMRYVLILLASLSPIGLLYRLIPLNPSWILNVSRLTDKVTSYENSKFVFLSYVAALAVTYAFHYRKMKDPKRIAVMFLQIMLIFPLILLLRLVFLGGDDRLDPAPIPINPEPASQDSADTDKSDVPLTPSNANDNAAWYYSKKFWGCVLFAGLAVVGLASTLIVPLIENKPVFKVFLRQGKRKLKGQKARHLRN